MTADASMKKTLIVIEDTEQARAAVSLLCDCRQITDCEVVLVCFRGTHKDWQRHSWTSARERVQEGTKQRAALAVAWQLLGEAGAFYKTRIAEGELASTVAEIATSEGCDHIILSRPAKNFLSRRLFAMTGIKLGSAVDRLLELADTPITVIGQYPEQAPAALAAG